MFKPVSLSEIFGQDHIIATLLSMDYQGQSIFFEGWMGTGKTSMAHIIAKQFASSKENVWHINCGEVSKVEEMRRFIKDFYKSSIFGKNKVYIFDEPQLLSTKAMNALLVPADELPKNLMVILCSAEAESVAQMLPERFIRFKTKPLDNKTSKEFLDFLCDREDITLDKLKKALVVEKCDGNPRRIVKAIPKIKDIEDLKDIEYLLDINSIEEDEEILKLFKLILSNAEWRLIRGTLNNLLKAKSPNTIRMGLLNLIGHGLLKGFGEGKEVFLVNSYNILKKAYEVPERSSLICAVVEVHLTRMENRV